MIAGQALLDKNKFTTWLVNVVLFTTIFAFSGYTDSSHQEQAVQTELVSLGNVGFKRTISFKETRRPQTGSAFVFQLCRGWMNRSLLRYASRMKTIVKNTAIEFLTHERPHLIFKIVFIPPSADEDNAALLRG